MDGALGGLEALLAAAKYVESQEQEKNQKLIEICEEYPSSEKNFSAEPVLPISHSVAATPLTSAPTLASKGVLLQNAPPAAAMATALAYVPERGGVHSSTTGDVTSSTVASFALSNGSSAASVIVTTLPSFSPTPSLTFTFTTPSAVSQTTPLLKLTPPVRLPSVPSVRHQTAPLIIQQQHQQQRLHAPSYSPPPHLPPTSSSAVARPLPLSQPQSQLPQPLSNSVPTITSLPQRPFVDRTAAAADLKRKLSNSGTREVHNKLEKNRRAHLKECFELLKNQVPAIQDEKKPSNLTILRTAIRYVQILRKREEELENELERLAKEKIVNQQRMTTLKKELSAQWDHLNFNSLIPSESIEPSKVPVSAENGAEHRRDYEIEIDADKMVMSDVDDSLSQAKSKGGGTYYGSSSSSGSCSISPLHISSPDVISTTSDGLPPQIHIVESIPYDKLTSTSGVTPIQFLSTSALRMITDGEQPMALVQHNGGDKSTSTDSTTLPKMAVHAGNTFTIFSDSFPKVTATNFATSGNVTGTTVPSPKLVTQSPFTHGVTPTTISMNHKNISLPLKSSFSQSMPNGSVTSASTVERNSSVLTTVPVHTTVRNLTNHSFVVTQPSSGQPSSGQMLLTSASSHLQTNVMPAPLLKTVSKLQPINGHHQLVVKPTMVVVSSSSVSK